MARPGLSLVRLELARQWPLCQSAMQDIIGHLHALGADQYAMDTALRTDFPDLPENAYGNTIAIELMHLLKNPAKRQKLEPAEMEAQTPVEETPEQRRREAQRLVGELLARDCGIVRIGEQVKVEYWGDGIAEKLSPDMRARIEACADELWELASIQRPTH